MPIAFWGVEELIDRTADREGLAEAALFDLYQVRPAELADLLAHLGTALGHPPR
jgi:hypothetical protein